MFAWYRYNQIFWTIFLPLIYNPSMKTFFPILFTILFLFGNSFALPLLLKAEKSIIGEGELLTFDSSKYENLRIGVSFVRGTPPPIGSFVYFFAVESEDRIDIGNLSINENWLTNSISIENVPSRINLSVKRPGTYRIYIWGK